ncbi:methyltransferase domain-containing protein [Mameliella alba]|uniref:Type 11 methyltransferase n=1 Tax=Mameliella alba TaxID=561184 RepID=A0A0B3RQL6_9RHOB|nr:methyltransferase domain-containing protein [Mameliella alba]KHQ50162.1 Type 11 methyltransferase [Mameliella alba]
MMNLAEKIGYLAQQAARRLVGATGCPNCGHDGFETRDRKALITELRDCSRCRLMYRYPTDPVEDSVDFYQEDYAQGFTTDMPGDAALVALKKDRFAGHEKDYAPLIALAEDLGILPGMRIFDFGCSWGFGSWQFTQAGYDVKSFEISRPRARYAREKLGVDVIDDVDALAAASRLDSSCDLFFSNHVLEHVPSPSDAVATARRLLRPGGLFVAITPNGSLGYRDVAPESWHRFWGKVHPNMLNDNFWVREFAGTPHFIGNLPHSRAALADWASAPGQVQDSQQGDQLICVARV